MEIEEKLKLKLRNELTKLKEFEDKREYMRHFNKMTDDVAQDLVHIIKHTRLVLRSGKHGSKSKV